MPTATPDRGWRLLVVLPVVTAVVLGAVVATGSWAGGDHPAPTATTGAAPVGISAESIHQFASLDELVAGSDLVVRGHVVSTARGRAVGGGDNAVVSRIVTIAVDDVLAGSTPASTVLVEEEGWLLDGRAVEVNGLSPSEEGLDAIWFLEALPGEVPLYLVVNHQGRYAVDGPRLRGAAWPDPLIEELATLGPAGLSAAVKGAAAP
jgi:hypothetical protein